jgi:hypothetical protein
VTDEYIPARIEEIVKKDEKANRTRTEVGKRTVEDLGIRLTSRAD